MSNSEPEQIINALDWYAEKAMAISRYLKGENLDPLMAVVKELELDAGARAKKALGGNS